MAVMEDDKTKGAPGERTVEEHVPRTYEEDVIDLGHYWAILRPNLWKIGLFSLGVGLLTLLLMFLMPNVYQATAVITPSIEEKKQIPALGALASFGVSIGGPSSVEDLESLFKSNDLTVRVFRKYNYWPIILAGKFIPATGKIKTRWSDRLFRGEKWTRAPNDWDAIRAVKDRLRVSVNRRSGTLSISFEVPSAGSSAEILNHYLEEGKSRLQEEALERAEKNKKFIQEQIGKTVDALTRDRLFTLYGQEVEREMMARNREQFGFRVIDTPRVPDRKSGPYRARATVTMTVLSFLAGCLIFLARGKRGVS